MTKIFQKKYKSNRYNKNLLEKVQQKLLYNPLLNMSHRIIFVNPIEGNFHGKYVVGSGVGSRNRSVQKALQQRASNNSQGKPCCISNTQNK